MTPSYGEALVTAPTWEPLTLAQAKAHCRVRHDRDNDLLSSLITAAREHVETVAMRAIPQQKWRYTCDQFPGRQVDDYRPPTWRYGILRLPRPPLQSVTLVAYVDPGQSTQPFTYTTLSAVTDYMVDTNTEPGRLAPAPFVVWPATNPLAFAAVKVEYVCGYASADLVPARLLQAVRLVVGHLYERREDAVEVALTRIPLGARAFIANAATGEYQ